MADQPTDDFQPRGWRDVYALVRDTRSDVLEAVATVDAKVDDHLADHKNSRGQNWTNARVLIQTVLPFPAAILAIIALLR